MDLKMQFLLFLFVVAQERFNIGAFIRFKNWWKQGQAGARDLF